MSVDPKDVAFFIPHNLKRFKLRLFDRIAGHIQGLGGMVVRHDYAALERTAQSKIPIIGCSPPFAAAIIRWQAEGRPWIYWDRGYLRRVFATWLPNGHSLGVPGGYYRWHVGNFQRTTIHDVPDDRWRALKLDECVKPWRTAGDKIVIAHTLPDYWQLRGLPDDWSLRLADELRRITSRPIVVRDKESKVPLDKELEGAHCLVTHGSIAAVEAVVMGYPVFVDASSAAAPMGVTNFHDLENPVFPDRHKWLHSLAYGQFNEDELCNGVLWRFIQ